MEELPVIVIFDVGKTNKKIFVFDEDYKIVYERSARFIESYDEDGDPGENLESLRLSIFDSLNELLKRKEFKIKAVNFSSYGASFVYIDELGKPVAPLYNYLKVYPEELKKAFYQRYGGEEYISSSTASPVLGSLNSGMQLYRVKAQKPALYEQIVYALHLPQYLSYLISGIACSDITSIGCHTQLWDFSKSDYHDWVKKEELYKKLAPIVKSNQVFSSIFPEHDYKVGTGLHDSSAALIPYLMNFHEPFLLISTGTWCITMNPFNNSPLTAAELEHDCLCYLQYTGMPVKASRIFAGYEHDQQVKRIGLYFKQSVNRYKAMKYKAEILHELIKNTATELNENGIKTSAFPERDLSLFADDEIAYHQLMLDIALQQQLAVKLVMNNQSVGRIFVDGGFSKNSIYMNLIAILFPEMEVFAAAMAQATAVGTALAIHDCWNSKPLPDDLVELRYYTVNHDLTSSCE